MSTTDCVLCGLPTPRVAYTVVGRTPTPDDPRRKVRAHGDCVETGLRDGRVERIRGHYAFLVDNR